MTKTHGATIVVRRISGGYRWLVMDGEQCVGIGWHARKMAAQAEARVLKRKYLKMKGTL